MHTNITAPHWREKSIDCRIHTDEQLTKITVNGTELLHSRIRGSGKYTLTLTELHPLLDAALAVWLEYQFHQNPELNQLRLTLPEAEAFSLLKTIHATYTESDIEISRERFYQLPWLWHLSTQTYPLHLGSTTSHRPSQYVAASDIDVIHPHRPAKPNSWIYQRHDTEFNRHIAFRVIDPEGDLEQFHAWQNQPRVAKFWEMALDHETLHQYLVEQQNDPHSLGLIGCLDGKAFGYFEIYWCLEDRLGAYYDALPYDRGWHGLTGSCRHLGRFNTITWIKALCHYMFLDDPRTERLMGEPRADNKTLLQYTNYIPYRHRGEFDFPHKRSALMQLNRSDFFQQAKL